MTFIPSVVFLYLYIYAECLHAEHHYDECRHAENHYAECPYAECPARGSTRAGSSFILLS